jgi:hypothetical protein
MTDFAEFAESRPGLLDPRWTAGIEAEAGIGA